MGGFLKQGDLYNKVLFVPVRDDFTYQKFIQQMDQAKQNYANQANIQKETMDGFLQVPKMTLGTNATSSWFLDAKNLTKESFQRHLLYELNDFIEKNEAFVLPMDMYQSHHVERIVFLNVESLAKIKQSNLQKELSKITKAIQTQQTFATASMRALRSAETFQRDLTKQSMASFANKNNQNQGIAKAKNVRFTGKSLTNKQQLSLIVKVVNQRISQRESTNTFKTQKLTYNRPNRRQPNEPNLKGQMTKTAYRPDIHVYIDTSGSITEREYKDGLMNIIMIVKKLNVNLFFTSFSHFVAQPVLVQTKGKSVTQIFKDIQNIHKAYGGTDYSNVWKAIDLLDDYNRINNKSYHLNFIVSDFEYRLRRDEHINTAKASTKNTFYLPIANEPVAYKRMVNDFAKPLAQALYQAGDKTIFQRMIV
jgi:hypothetical protein